MEASPRQCHRSARSVRRSQILARAAFVGLGATPRKSQNQRLRAVTSPSSTTALTLCSGTNPSTVEPSWTLVRIPASARSKRAGAVAASVGGLFRLRIRQRQPVAAPRHHLSDTLFVLVWLSDNRRLAVFVLVFFILVFLVFIIVIIGSRGGAEMPMRLNQVKGLSGIRKVMSYSHVTAAGQRQFA